MGKAKEHKGFYIQEGYLYCEGLSVKEIQKRVDHSPFYLYSALQIRRNYDAYAAALEGIPAVISYAVKANGNLAILKSFRAMGSWVTLVSGNELRLALAAGFDPDQAILNGNGKTLDELRYAIESGVMVNVDSEFDLEHIFRASEETGRPANVLLRINPDIDPLVHPYISTGLRGSKFGIQPEQIDWFLRELEKTPALSLVGVHCHLGSTIEKVDVFRQVMESMAGYFESIRQRGFAVKYLNIGGGLGINYKREGEAFPEPGDLVAAVRDRLPEGAILILEPGRSLVGNAAVLVCRVIGVKLGGEVNFIVVDGSMAELIRPSLYQAYHQIGYIEPVMGEERRFDIVGPVCESADFLGKERLLRTPDEGTGIAVFDAGAYCYAMSSNYNARMRPPEYLVDGRRLTQIRRAERFEEHLRMFDI